MLKKLALYFGLAVGLNMNAFALVGGPFDGGDYNQGLDDAGVFQASFRFKNGSGFAQWGNNVDMRPTDGVTTVGSTLNRSLIYYKGISYLGSAAGMVDYEAKRVTGFSNASAETTFETDGSTATPGQTIPTFTNGVSNGGRAFVANASWSAKITHTRPTVRFRGQGQIAFLGPDATTLAADALADLAEETLDSINEGVNTALPDPIEVPLTQDVLVETPVYVDDDDNPATPDVLQSEFEYREYARPIADILADQQTVVDFTLSIADDIAAAQLANLESVRKYLEALDVTNSPSKKQDVVILKLHVFGNRRFFVGSR